MKHYWLLILIMSLLLVACGSENEPTATPLPPTNTPQPAPTNTPVPSGETVRGQAMVDSIEIEMLESFPVQVNVIARGALADGCTSIDDVIQQFSDDTFRVVITTMRQADAMCTQALVPFSQTIALDVEGLDAGNYAVTVNGRTGSFTLQTDNRLEEPALEPEPTTEADNSATISGTVWHDLCATVEGAEEIPAGCIALTDDTVIADGELTEGEPGLEGIVVNLGAGACPATGLDETTTNAAGEYTFANLPAGEYCISIDAEADENTAVLDPGRWSFPDVDTSATAVTLTTGQTLTDINFGWDYTFLPVPEVDPATCTNTFAFVADLTVPDDTIFAPGTEFVKTWRLRNTGTCPWTTAYTFVAVDDETLPGETEVPLTETIVPGQTLDISVSLIAPTEPGTYRSNWQLANANGERFGVGGFIEDAVFVRIIVDDTVDTTITPEPNSGVLGGVVWADYCVIQANGSPSTGCIEVGENSGVYIANGTYNTYESPIPELLVTLSNSACPTDGTIPPSSIIATTTTDEEGLYRFEGLDAGTYCVAINAFDEANLNLLIPGDWTYPFPGVGRWGVVLQVGGERLDLDFGWDYQFD